MSQEFRKKRRALEVLASQGLLYCEKHRNVLDPRMLYRKRCYSSRREDYDICPYLKIDGRLNKNAN